jgi:hypothetical protein
MKTLKHRIQSIELGQWLRLALGALILALPLAWVSTGFLSIHGWISFFAVLLLSSSLLWLGWRTIRAETPPIWLLTALAAGILIRLAFGMFWFLALPAWGYNTPVQNAGYIMEDAYDRDGAAWQLAQSETPLLAAFQDYSSTDQYGGLLAFSGFIYRYLGSDFHQPLLMIVISAASSGLAVIFTWAFSRRIWGEKTARIAAWILVLYPEAILLGSSQMREAFMVTLAMAALYGLTRYWQERSWVNLTYVVVPLLASVPLSIPFALLLFGVVIFSALSLDGWRVLRSKRFWLGIGGITLLLIVLHISNVFDIEKLWPFQAARWQAYYSESASGWVQRTFRMLPEGMEWVQVPFLVVYGIFRPLLPASFFDGIPMMRAVGIWRASGWTILLALLFYAAFLALRGIERQKMTGGLITLSWMIILVASLRGGGDQWDNPRYRSSFAGIQVGLASWALVKQRETADSWLRRAAVGTVMMVVWFIPWYLRRYTIITWPVVALHQTIGLGLVSGILYILWDWIKLRDSQDSSLNGNVA